MALPTPCTEWDVRTLLTHLVGGNLRWAGVARGEPMRRGPAQGGGPAPDLLGDDPAGAYRRSAAALKEAWRDPALLDRPFELPIGVLPGRAAVNLHLVETVTHGWDLARATGQESTFDPDVVGAALQFAQSNTPGERPPSAVFAPPVAVDDDLPEIDRLAAYLGRAP
jgi:uncharacterized protein (TIGR03086 family)